DLAHQGGLGDGRHPAHLRRRQLSEAERGDRRLRLRAPGRGPKLTGLRAEESLERVGELPPLELGELLRQTLQRAYEAPVAQPKLSLALRGGHDPHRTRV